MRLYSIVIEDYLNKKTSLINSKKYIDKYNALFELESYIYSFIDEKSGIKINRPVYRRPKSINSNTYKYYPYGYLVLRDFDILDKFYIYEKIYVSGYIYNSFKINKIFSIQIMESDEDCEINYSYDYNKIDSDIIIELLDYFK